MCSHFSLTFHSLSIVNFCTSLENVSITFIRQGVGAKESYIYKSEWLKMSKWSMYDPLVSDLSIREVTGHLLKRVICVQYLFTVLMVHY